MREWTRPEDGVCRVERMTRLQRLRWRKVHLAWPLGVLACFTTVMPAEGVRHDAWTIYRGGNESLAYSSLDEINRDNVASLEVAWTYHTGDGDAGNRSTIQSNPIVIRGVMYVTSPQLKLIALDPVRGTERWRFDSATTIISPR